MKIMRNFQLTLCISILGIPFLGQAAQVTLTPVSSIQLLPSPIQDSIKHLNDSIATVTNRLRLVELQQAVRPTSIVPSMLRQQLSGEQQILQTKLAKVQEVLAVPRTPRPINPALLDPYR
jgi:hypothetical protein